MALKASLMERSFNSGFGKSLICRLAPLSGTGSPAVDLTG